jgi:putative Ca2+/H+ antiporter (TMEM165/GDT1 family)
MDLRLFATVFVSIFVAELGDKTQLATVLYSADATSPKLTVFAAASLALIATSAIGVIAGSALAAYVTPKLLSRIAGFGFIAIGVLTLWRGAE